MSTGNKFTRSVLERLEQEQQKPTQPKNATITEKKTTSKKVTPPKKVKEKAIESDSAPKTPDLSQFFTKKNERVAKNKTFYLDEEVINAIRQAATTQSMTDSRLVNEILRSVLGVS